MALRDLTDPSKRYVKAAVLPKVRDSELALLELRLQMQKDLKEPYSLGHVGGYDLTAVAEYSLTARVLSTRRYRYEKGCDLAPIDHFLGGIQRGQAYIGGHLQRPARVRVAPDKNLEMDVSLE